MSATAARPDAAPPGASHAPAAPVAARARAVWGLVDDAYGLVAHTPGLDAAAADAVATAVAVGNPAFDIDDAVAVLHDPALGWLCARVYTDARRDSHGRGVLVTDVVVLDDAVMAALRHDALGALPPLPATRSPDADGVIPAPAFAPGDADDEAALLAAARAHPDAPALRPLLAALLAGDRVLWTGDAPALPLLRALTLLLPPALRGALTLQTVAVQPPRLAPRLTVAPRLTALLAEVPWTARLPEQGDALPPDALALADALLALPADALRAAHARYAALGVAAPVGATPGDGRALGVEVARLLRLAALDDAVRAGAAVDALRLVDADAPPAERAAAASALAALAPDALGAAAAELLAQGEGGAPAVACALAELARMGPATAPHLLAVLRRVPASLPPDADAAPLRAALAAVAAWHDDAAGVVAWATPDADWAWLDARLGASAAAQAAPRTRALLAALAAADASSAQVAQALTDVAPALPPAVRRRAAQLGLAAVRRAFAASPADASDAARLEAAARAAAALRALWRVAPPAGEARAFAVLLGAAADPAERVDEAPRAVAAALRALPEPARGRELDAWCAALVADALASSALASPALAPPALAAPAAASRALDAAARLVDAVEGGSDARARLGALLADALPDGPPAEHAAAWGALLARADDATRRELAVRALLAAARPAPGGGMRAGAFAEACAAAAAAGLTPDDAALSRLGDALGDAFAHAEPGPAAAAALELALAALGALADGARAAALAQRVAARAPASLRDALRLRRLAAAVAEVERARDERTHAELCALLRDGAAPQRPADEMLLRVYLGVPAEPAAARARRAARGWWDALRGRRGGAGGA